MELPGAFTDGALNRPKSKAINKIGHYLHELNPKYRAFTLENPNVQALAKGLAVHEDPRVIQSMVRSAAECCQACSSRWRHPRSSASSRRSEAS